MLHSAEQNPSLPRPELPAIASPQYTAPLHNATQYPSPRRLSQPPLTPPPFTPALHSAALHSQFSLGRTDNLPSSSFSSSNRVSTATPDHLLISLQLPSVKQLIRQLSVKRQPATLSSSNRTPKDLLSVPFPTFTLVKIELGQLRLEQPLPTMTPSNSGAPKNSRSSRTSFRSLKFK
jgi:hypothetical protein